MKKKLYIMTTLLTLFAVFSQTAYAAATQVADHSNDTSTTTLWISIICGVAICAVITFVIVMAKKNKGN